MKSTEFKQRIHDATHSTTTDNDGQPKESLRMRVFVGGFTLLAVGGGLVYLNSIDDADQAGIRDSLNVQIGQKVLHPDTIDPDQEFDTSFSTDSHKVLVNRIGQGPCVATFSVYRGGEHGPISKKILDHLAPNRAVITGVGTCDPATETTQKEHASVPPITFPVPSAHPSKR